MLVNDEALAVPPVVMPSVEPMMPSVGPIAPVEAVSVPTEPMSASVEPVLSVESVESVESGGPAVPVESVLSVLCGARDVVARVSRVPLGGADSDVLAQVIAAGGRLRSAVEAVLLAATAALEAACPGSGRTVLRDQARVSVRNAKRTAEVSEQVAQMPNTQTVSARGCGRV